MTTATSDTTTTAGDATGTTSTDTSTTAAAATDSTASTETTAGEGQGEAGTTGEATETAKADEEAAATGAPESYEAFTLPEGFALDGERHESTVALFKELDLPQATAQKLIDAFCKTSGEDASVLQTLIDGKRQEQITTWGEQSKTEFGGKYDELVTDARAGVAHMATTRPGTLDTFDSEGWGNHPDALAAFAEIGRLARGSAMRGMGGETATGGERSLADRLYGGTK
jgi:hypothetical protein